MVGGQRNLLAAPISIPKLGPEFHRARFRARFLDASVVCLTPRARGRVAQNSCK